jgi:hypothetical protein
MLSFFRILQYLPSSSHPNITRSINIEENSEIISQLKFISKIRPGEQVNVDNLSICSRNIFSGIYRSMYGEGRDKTLHFFTIIIRRAFEKIQAYSNSEKMSEHIVCVKLIENLFNAIQGLENAKDTYQEDRRFVCDIETMIENIQSKLEELKVSKPEFFVSFLEKGQTLQDHKKIEQTVEQQI